MYRFKVSKMGCGGCVKSVTRAVEAIEPNARVEVDLGAKLVVVSEAGGPSESDSDVSAASIDPAAYWNNRSIGAVASPEIVPPHGSD